MCLSNAIQAEKENFLLSTRTIPCLRIVERFRLCRTHVRLTLTRRNSLARTDAEQLSEGFSPLTRQQSGFVDLLLSYCRQNDEIDLLTFARNSELSYRQIPVEVP
jgi:hypothetical protein